MKSFARRINSDESRRPVLGYGLSLFFLGLAAVSAQRISVQHLWVGLIVALVSSALMFLVWVVREPYVRERFSFCLAFFSEILFFCWFVFSKKPDGVWSSELGECLLRVGGLALAFTCTLILSFGFLYLFDAQYRQIMQMNYPHLRKRRQFLKGK